MECTRQNFADIVQYLLDKNDDQSLIFFLTKLFYFLRRNQNESHFDFFFEALRLNSKNGDSLLYKKLCEWQFYVDELLQIYSKTFTALLHRFLADNVPLDCVKDAIYSGGSVLQFKSIYQIFEGTIFSDIPKILHIWDDNKIPSSVLESALAVSFPDPILLDNFVRFDDFVVYSEDFNDILNEKSKNMHFDKILWSRVIKLNLNDNDSASISSNPDIKEILVNLQSQEPTDVAFGLFNIRKLVEKDTKFEFEPEKQLIDSIVSLVSHNDR